MEWKEAVAIVDLARWRLCRAFPWARRTLRAVQWYPATHGTLSIDKWLRCYVDPAAVERWQDKIDAVVWHEVNHVLRRHFDRINPDRGYRDQTAANVVCDMEINGEIRDYVTLPQECVVPENLGHLWDGKRKTAEEYYRLLPVVSVEVPGDGFCGTDPTEDQGEGDAPSQGDKGRVGRILQEQDRDIVTAAKESDGIGNIPASLVAEALKRLHGGHDWRSTLGNVIRSCIEQAMDDAEEHTYRRPSRRQVAADDVILPRSYRPIPDLWVVVDVSGSMDERKLTASLRELHAILNRAAIPHYTAVTWDTELHGTYRINGPNDIAQVFKVRGGGTDMGKGIAHAQSQGAEIVVCLTDCQSPWHYMKPTTPVVVGGINRGNSRDPRKDHPWVKLVDIESVGETP